MATEEKKDLTPEQVRQRKSYWIAFAISFAVSLALAVGSFFLIKAGFDDFEAKKWVILADTFTLPGVLYLLVFLLVKVSDYGAFDAIVYSVRLVLGMVFHDNIRKTKLPATYGEYRLIKRGKPRTNATFLLLAAAPYIILMIVFVILYYVGK